MKRINWSLWICIFSILGFIGVSGSLALAQGEFPTGPITMMAGSTPGAPTDAAGRALSNLVKPILGQPMVLINKAGMSHSLMTSELKSKEPDGYTLGIAAATAVTLNHHLEKLDYTADDFTYIRTVGSMLHGVCVRSDSPWKTFEEFIDYAKKNPGKIKFSSYSPISTLSMVMLMIAQEKNINWVHVPFKGGGPAATALLGGHVEALAGVSEAIPYVRNGQVRILVLFNGERSKLFPDVPTLKDLGYKIPSLSDMSSTLIITAPKGLKSERLAKLSNAFEKAAQDPIYFKVMDSYACPVMNLGPEATKKMVFTYREEANGFYPALIKQMSK